MTSTKNYFAINQAYYETTAFSLRNICISSCRILVLYKWQGQLFTLLNIFSLPFSFGKRCFFSTKPTGFFDIRVHFGYWRPSCWHLRATFIPGKRPRALSYIHDSSSLICRNSYCVLPNVSNSLLLLTFFGRECCFKLSFGIKSRAMRYHNFWFIIIRFKWFLQTLSENSEKPITIFHQKR